MVERALLERFASPTPAIQDYFRGGLHQPAVRTTASVTFGYHPTTKPINAQLLAEQDREELAKEEALSRQAAAGDIRAASRAPAGERTVRGGIRRHQPVVQERHHRLLREGRQGGLGRADPGRYLRRRDAPRRYSGGGGGSVFGALASAALSDEVGGPGPVSPGARGRDDAVKSSGRMPNRPGRPVNALIVQANPEDTEMIGQIS